MDINYDSSEKQAFDLVDLALNNAIRNLINESNPPLAENQMKPYLADQEMPVANIEWPENFKFNPQVGKTKIGEFIVVNSLLKRIIYALLCNISFEHAVI